MRDYGNIPVLKWQGAISAKKAEAQIHHAEPLILKMPDDFQMKIDASACGCRDGNKAGNHIDCNAESILKALAKDNDLPELAQLATTAHAAGQVVDIDTDSRHIVIHD
ncbi:MAG: hypothetical protein P8Z75_04520 [Gammaproteobacteria bacterium]|jgi:hypothetical protein